MKGQYKPLSFEMSTNLSFYEMSDMARNSTRKKMPRTNQPVVKNAEHFFNLIATNAIEFFIASIKDFKSRPKYSVINFCSGLELILKARLIKEHWSLIVKRPEEAALSQFQNGDFMSVSVDEALKRLANIGGDTFSQDETRCFKRLRDHRNKVVHFCHDAYSRKPDAKLLEEVAAEQCMAWCYLHRRLTGIWSEYFEEHSKAVERLNGKLHRHRAFLRVKFTTLRPDIKKEISAGAEYRICSACGFHSARVDEVYEPVRQIECRVCGTRKSFMRLACPQCRKFSDIDDLASGSCDDEDCGADISLGNVMKEYVPAYDPRDEEEQAYYCAACENPEPSVTTLGDRYFCFWCKEWFDTTAQCGFCGYHLVGFDPNGSSLYGCFMCDTAAREHFDKD
jgi:hypothetical protein